MRCLSSEIRLRSECIKQLQWRHFLQRAEHLLRTHVNTHTRADLQRTVSAASQAHTWQLFICLLGGICDVPQQQQKLQLRHSVCTNKVRVTKTSTAHLFLMGLTMWNAGKTRKTTRGATRFQLCWVWDLSSGAGVKQRSSPMVPLSTCINDISRDKKKKKKVSILGLFYFSPPDNIIPLRHSHRLAAFIRFLHHTTAPPPPPNSTQSNIVFGR